MDSKMKASEFVTEVDNKVKLRGFNTQAQRERALDFIDNVYLKFPMTSPINPDHHAIILDTDENGQATAFAFFELKPSDAKPGAVDIDWIQTMPQGQGNGRRAMTMLQDLAREANIALTLYPSRKHKMPQSELKAIYKKLGFAPIKGGDNMIWQPNTISEAGGYVPVNDKEAKDPRYVQAVSVDVKPGETQRQAAKLGFKTDRAGKPPLLHSKAAKNTNPNTSFNLGIK
jgi:GNAT superfamily N-acetyltransferase